MPTNITRTDNMFSITNADGIAILKANSLKAGGQLVLEGVTFGTAGVTVEFQSVGVTADEWDSVDLAGIVGHTLILDREARFSQIRVSGLSVGNNIGLYQWFYK